MVKRLHTYSTLLTCGQSKQCTNSGSHSPVHVGAVRVRCPALGHGRDVCPSPIVASILRVSKDMSDPRLHSLFSIGGALPVDRPVPGDRRVYLNRCWCPWVVERHSPFTGPLGTLTMNSMGSLSLLLKALRMMSTACWWVTPRRVTPSTDTSSNPALRGERGGGGGGGGGGGERETGRERGFGTGLEQMGNKVISGAMHKAYFV